MYRSGYKWIILVLCFSYFLDLAGQELGSTHINQVDDRGRKQGLWKVYDPTGEMKYTGNYVDGNPVGEFIYYYPTGLKQAMVMNYNMGKTRYMTMYHPDGKMMAHGKYVAQKKDSTWTYYSGEDGTLNSEEYYDMGVKQGEWKTYYESGQVMEIIKYQDDLREGPWIQYFSDGSVKAEGYYKNDELDGLYVLRHLNGNVEVSGSYKNSKKDGTWVYLSEIGELLIRETFKNDVLIKKEEFTPTGDKQD